MKIHQNNLTVYLIVGRYTAALHKMQTGFFKLLFAENVFLLLRLMGKVKQERNNKVAVVVQ